MTRIICIEDVHIEEQRAYEVEPRAFQQLLYVNGLVPETEFDCVVYFSANTSIPNPFFT